MAFTIIDAEQRTPAWFAARAGRLTASCAREMLATVQKGEAAARRDLRARLVVERLTGLPEDDGTGYVNGAMQWGLDHEQDALAAYEALTGNLATSVGFLAHTELMAGASPDGVIGDFDGLVELKCPKSATHFSYLRGSVAAPAEHLAQLTHLLWLTGCPWVDFLSFDPRFPNALQTFYVRVKREDVDVDGYGAKATAFLEEVDREVAAAKGWSVLQQTA
jgi:hypothetical protein